MDAANRTRREFIYSLFVIILFITIVVISSIILLPKYWLLHITIVISGVFLLVNWHSKTTSYVCPNCKNTFGISMIQDLTGPNAFTKKYLECPRCHHRNWVKEIPRKMN